MLENVSNAIFLFCNFLFTVILIYGSVYERDCRQGMSHLLVLAVRNEPRALMLGRTVSEYIQKGTLECIVAVLGRILVRGWFYSQHSFTTAEDSLVVV